MVHWTFYPVMGAVIAGFLVFSYYYLRWARFMDRVNADHFEFQKQGLWIEGISYFVAKEPFSLEYQFPLPVENIEETEG